MEIKEVDTSKLPPDGGDQYNRLIFEPSPYLQQHAANPIDWYPWSEAALSRSVAEDKPIFLSIGYATCHWCHVMARESFADSEVANLLNENFIAVKVDREERPDLDAIYMKICQEVTGSGGWPLNVILTPERKPFLVGTYFPRDNRYGRPGILEILTRTKELWRKDRERLVASANRVVALVAAGTGEEAAVLDSSRLLELAYQQLASSYDREFGGFGTAPKFPVPHQYLFLLRYWRRTGEEAARRMVVHSLIALRQGGIYDHLGFGFHRYSTDRELLVPHFEKMLYDQALLALAYLEAYQASGDRLLADTAREIFTYVERELSAPEGGFYSAEDADTEGEEGRFYLWRREEINAVLGEEEGRRFCAKYRINSEGNFRDEASGERKGWNIPHLGRNDTRPDEMAESRLRLLERRRDRVRPFLDDKILSGWNGLMIAALARGGRVLDDPGLTGRAAQGAEFILKNMLDDQGGLLRSYRRGTARINAFQEDYAYLVWGLLELFESTFAPRYLEEAASLNRKMFDFFTDDEGSGGLTLSGKANEQLVMPVSEFYDGALPSGNSVALFNLARLSGYLDDPELAARAEKLADACSGAAANYPAGQTMFLVALDLLRGPGGEIVVAGKKDDPLVREALRLINATYAPEQRVLLRDESLAVAELCRQIPWLAGKTDGEEPLTIYLCRNFTCRRPIHDLADLRLELEKLSPLGSA